MQDVELLAEWIDDLSRDVRETIKDLPPDAIDWQPDAAANSIGVTIFHFSRWLDLLSVRAMDDQPPECEQWHTRGWAEKTGYDPRGIGVNGFGAVTGYSLEEVAAIPKLSADDLLTYLEQVASALSEHLRMLPAGALHESARGLGASRSVYRWVKPVLKGCLGHIGEIAALRAMYERQTINT